MPSDNFDFNFDRPRERAKPVPPPATNPDELPMAWELGDDSADAGEPPVAQPVEMQCRRCGETSVPLQGRCRWCAARLIEEPPRPKPRRRRVYSLDDEPEDDYDRRDRDREEIEYAIPVRRPHLIPPIAVVIVSYVALLGVSVAFLVVAIFRGMTTEEDIHTGTAIVELIDAFLTFAALALVWRSARQKVPEGTMGLAWVSATPVLFLLLCLNILYITFLRELFKPFGAPQPERMKLTFFVILIICV